MFKPFMHSKSANIIWTNIAMRESYKSRLWWACFGWVHLGGKRLIFVCLAISVAFYYTPEARSVSCIHICFFPNIFLYSSVAHCPYVALHLYLTLHYTVLYLSFSRPFGEVPFGRILEDSLTEFFRSTRFLRVGYPCLYIP